MTATTAKRPTLATLKAFVRKNEGKLYIRTLSSFNGMTDGCDGCDDQSIHPAQTPETLNFSDGTIGTGHPTHDLGILGCWLVGSSRDYITPADVPGFVGFHVYNSCGSFDLLIPQEG